MKPEFVLPDIHPLIKWKLIRTARDADLAASDYAAMPDYPMADKDRPVFVAYRQGLRDIPDQGADPDAVVWPKKPTFLK
ncbi:phage tail assembly chaperone [Pseudomonas fluorescens]|uniref:tail fiber assembly protein n=1 Tax=Pseudomonas fluorescens TaxID=294 RepID=UPI0021D320D0|nr:tail fiber assembly protein [Pseudomonas fluorescens]UXV20932.1 phage tail assembly chaperone [Pseudomonas fluorescens]